MNERIIGSFYLELNDGNLTGHYTNLTISVTLEENALRRGENTNEFIGDYNSSWAEIIRGTDRAILSIGLLPGSESKFTLIWHYKGRIYFRGEGFLIDGKKILIGHYTN